MGFLISSYTLYINYPPVVYVLSLNERSLYSMLIYICAEIEWMEQHVISQLTDANKHVNQVTASEKSVRGGNNEEYYIAMDHILYRMDFGLMMRNWNRISMHNYYDFVEHQKKVHYVDKSAATTWVWGISFMMRQARKTFSWQNTRLRAVCELGDAHKSHSHASNN